MSSALRLAVIDIGFILWIWLAMAVPGCRPARSVKRLARAIGPREHRQYNDYSGRSQGKLWQRRESPRQVEYPPRPQLSLLHVGERDQRALGRNRDASFDDRSVPPAQQHRLATRKPASVGAAHRQGRQRGDPGTDRQQEWSGGRDRVD